MAYAMWVEDESGDSAAVDRALYDGVAERLAGG